MINETPTCELSHCASKQQDLHLIYVDQNIEDGCYKVGICLTCANILDLHPGSDLPYDGMAGELVNQKLKAAIKRNNEHIQMKGRIDRGKTHKSCVINYITK